MMEDSDCRLRNSYSTRHSSMLSGIVDADASPTTPVCTQSAAYLPILPFVLFTPLVLFSPLSPLLWRLSSTVARAARIGPPIADGVGSDFCLVPRRTFTYLASSTQWMSKAVISGGDCLAWFLRVKKSSWWSERRRPAEAKKAPRLAVLHVNQSINPRPPATQRYALNALDNNNNT
ncbi:hypothetical protein VTN96DRAFT_7854 [Rasamsonia emersonii]